MDLKSLRNYGVAASDYEARWPCEVKQRMAAAAQQVVLKNLDMGERMQFGFSLMTEKTKAANIDLSPLPPKVRENKSFLKQQMEFLATFVALEKMKGRDEATRIMNQVMEESAVESLLLTLPEPDDVQMLPDAFDALRKYFRQLPVAASDAQCHDMEFRDLGKDQFGLDITWCVWRELAKLHGVPDACKTSCHADDLVYPDYFEKLGIRYQRTSTLAHGAACCDFRWERLVHSPLARVESMSET